MVAEKNFNGKKCWHQRLKYTEKYKQKKKQWRKKKNGFMLKKEWVGVGNNKNGKREREREKSNRWWSPKRRNSRRCGPDPRARNVCSRYMNGVLCEYPHPLMFTPPRTCGSIKPLSVAIQWLTAPHTLASTTHNKRTTMYVRPRSHRRRMTASWRVCCGSRLAYPSNGDERPLWIGTLRFSAVHNVFCWARGLSSPGLSVLEEAFIGMWPDIPWYLRVS